MSDMGIVPTCQGTAGVTQKTICLSHVAETDVLLYEFTSKAAQSAIDNNMGERKT
jgi:hypothetical protein